MATDSVFVKIIVGKMLVKKQAVMSVEALPLNSLLQIPYLPGSLSHDVVQENRVTFLLPPEL